MRIERTNGRRLLMLTLALLTCGCVGHGPPYRYRAIPPAMTVAPIFHRCDLIEGETRTPEECVTLLRHDYRELVKEIKAACLAAGGTDGECLVTTRKD